ncbi:hypothetical protein GCM10007940_47900 [Portibacter lacus]|uniref:Uncharacterized protein n=2 Tax=Portibacter lacus TaxID=1099794 RepID=A0AA37WHX7_9BACT|nr:hypothetical protein GCM10007940_47900 [Portibacter lacus]
MSCQDSKIYKMDTPKTKPPLFNLEAGLEQELMDREVIFEKYIQTRIGNAEANRIYDNGDIYKIFLGSNQNIKKDDISWEKVGTLSEKGIEKLKSISENEVQDFIKDGPHERVAQAIENINWYFYFGETILVQSQSRQWKRDPKFARKIEKAIESNFKPAFLEQ